MSWRQAADSSTSDRAKALCHREGTDRAKALCHREGTDRAKALCHREGTDRAKALCHRGGTDSAKALCHRGSALCHGCAARRMWVAQGFSPVLGSLFNGGNLARSKSLQKFPRIVDVEFRIA